MTRRSWSALLGAILLSCISGAVFAQEPVRERPQRQVEPQPAVRPDVNRADAEEVRLVRTSKLMDAKVVDPAGDHLGRIENLAINTEQGRIAYAVLSFGGFLKIGDKLFAVPWPALQIRTQDRVVLNTNKDTLRDMPGFKGHDWPATADARWLQNMPGGPAGAYREAGAEENEALPRYTAKGSDLVGKKVLNKQGDNLGTLHDLVVDPRTGRIIYGVISHGGALGVGSKLVPVPWSTFDTTQKDHLRLNIDRARFDTAPTFSNDNWTVLSDPDFTSRTYTFYGQKPYWQAGQTGGPGTAPRGAMERERENAR